MKADVVTDLSVRAERSESSHAVEEGQLTFARQAGRDRNGVLFCDARVDEARAQLFCHLFESRITKVSCQENKIGSLLVERADCFSKFRTHLRNRCVYVRKNSQAQKPLARTVRRPKVDNDNPRCFP